MAFKVFFFKINEKDFEKTSLKILEIFGSHLYST